jgi:hypothetical protein
LDFQIVEFSNLRIGETIEHRAKTGSLPALVLDVSRSMNDERKRIF